MRLALLTIPTLAVLAGSPALQAEDAVGATRSYAVMELPALGVPREGNGRTISRGEGISRTGLAVGWSSTTGQAVAFPHAATWTPYHLRAVAPLDGGGWTVVGLPGRITTAAADPAAWTSQALEAQDRRLWDVTGGDLSSSAQMPRIAVGSRGGIYVGSSSSPRPIIWTQLTLSADVTPTLTAVAQASAVDSTYMAVAVGDDGSILQSTSYGSSWTQVPSPTTAGLQAAAVLTPDVAVVGGSGDALYVWNGSAVVADPDGDGSAWNPVLLPGLAGGNAVTDIAAVQNGSTWTVVCVATDGSAYTRTAVMGDTTRTIPPLFDGAWTRTEVAQVPLRSVSLIASGGTVTGLAVGDAGVVVRLENGVWAADPQTVTTCPLHGVALADAVAALAIGDNGVVIRRTAGGWVDETTPVSIGTTDIGVSPGGVMSRGYAINAAGKVVGEAHRDADRVISGFFSSPFTLVGTTGFNAGSIEDVNEAGVMAGTVINTDPSDPLQDGVARAAVITPNGGGVAVLDTLGGNTSVGKAINNRNQRFRNRHIQVEEAVGRSANASGTERAFVYRPMHLNDACAIIEDIFQREPQVAGHYDPLNFPNFFIGPLPIDYPYSNASGTWNWFTIRHGGNDTRSTWYWYAGANGTILFTNGGAAPLRQVSGVSSDLFGIDFYDSQNGVAVGEGGVVLFTVDGGITWTRATRDDGVTGPITARDLYDVHFVKGGSPAQEGLEAFRAQSARIVFACGAGGTILKSIDGGATWRVQPSGTSNDLFAISFPGDGYIPWSIRRDAVRGWVVGDEVALFTDSSGEPTGGGPGGEAKPGWTDSELPIEFRRSVYWGVDAYLPNTVFLSGERGILLRGFRPTASSKWQFVRIPLPLGSGTPDLYSVKATVSNYTYNNGDEPQPGAPRLLGNRPEPVPCKTIAPGYGTWNSWTEQYSDGTIIPMLTVTGQGGRIFYTGRNSPNFTGVVRSEADFRGVDARIFDIFFDNEDNDGDANPQQIRNPNTGAMVDGYNTITIVVAGTDGQAFAGAGGNDCLNFAGLQSNWTGGIDLVTIFNPGPDGAPNTGTAPPRSGVVIGGLDPDPSGTPWRFGSLSRYPGEMRDLGALQGSDAPSEARDIDDAGTVVGVSMAAASSVRSAFLLRKRTGAFAYDPMLDLGTLGGRSAEANAISRIFGIVVGTSTRYFGSVERPRAFVWQSGRMQDLNDLIDPVYAGDPSLRWVLTSATDINEYGEISGNGFLDANGDGIRNTGEQERGFVLHPLIGTSNAAPTAVIVHPAGGEAFTASVDVASTPVNPDQPQNVIIGVLATDTDGTIAKVEFYIGDTLIGAATSTAQGGGGGGAGYFQTTWTTPAGIPVAQSQTITAVVTDNLGRRTVSKPITVTVVPPGQQVVAQDLGTLGGDTSEAFAVNNLGEVVGRAQTSRGSLHAFRWSDTDGMVDLGVIDQDADQSEAFDINDQGIIVGRSRVAADSLLSQAVVWIDDGIRPVPGALSATSPSAARGLSPLDQIAGSGPTSYGAQLGWMWRTATEGTIPLPTLGGFSGEAASVNAYRRVTGRAQDPSGEFQAYRWDRGFPYGSMTAITTAQSGVLGSEGRGINYAGDAVGLMQLSAGFRGFLWRAQGGVTTLNPLGGDTRSEAYSINDGSFALGDAQLRVVGRSVSQTGVSRAALWFNNGTSFDLSQALPPGTGFSSLIEARDVNNSGLIVGTGINGGKKRAYALRIVETTTAPVNTPPTVVMTTPSSGQRLTSASPMRLTAIAADGDGAVSKVDFWLGGTTTNDNLLIGSVEQATTIGGVSYYAFTWNTPQAGSYYVVAVATDNRGATSTSLRIPVTVSRPENNTAPQGVITRVGSATVASGIARVTDGGVLTVSGTAADDAGLAKVDLYLISGANEPVLQGTAVLTGTARTWSIPLLAEQTDGTYTVVAVVTEASVGGQPAQVTVSQPVVYYLNELLVTPIPAPVVRITNPSVDSVVEAGARVPIAATIDQGEVDSVAFLVAPLWTTTTALTETGSQAGFTLLGVDDTPLDGFTYTWTGVEPGIYGVYALATDASGRRGISPVRVIEVRHGILRIESEADGELAVPAGSVFTYVLRVWVKDANGVSLAQPGDRLLVTIIDPDPDDGVDLVSGPTRVITDPLGVEATLLHRTIVWTAVAPTDGSDHVRIRIRAVLDNGDSDTTNDPMDIQDVLIQVQPAAATGG